MEPNPKEERRNRRQITPQGIYPHYGGFIVLFFDF